MTRRGWNDRPEIVAHDVVTRALHRVGEIDPGPWSEALEVLTRSLDTQAALHRAGRKRARNDLVDLAAARGSTVDTPPPVLSGVVWVLGLPGTGAGDLAEHLGARLGTPPVDPMLREFASISFEARWHAPAYGEWLATADLRAAYREAASRVARSGAPTVFTGWGHLERLDELAEATPGSRIVVVEPDDHEPAAVLGESSARLRRRDSADVDDHKVARYWAWRVGTLLERHEQAATALPADRVLRLSAAEVRRRVHGVVDDIVAGR